LSTSQQLDIRAVVCQNDCMTIGARKALIELPVAERKPWLDIPFLGCDGVRKTGQEWVRTGQLRATVVIPPMAGHALEMLVKAIDSGSMPAERTLCSPRSFPDIADLGALAARA
jgi:ribose transport system substrate-binding protein